MPKKIKGFVDKYKIDREKHGITLAGIGALSLPTLIKVWWYARKRYRALERRAGDANRLDRSNFYETVSQDALVITNGLIKAALEDEWSLNPLDSAIITSLSDSLENMYSAYAKLASDAMRGMF